MQEIPLMRKQPAADKEKQTKPPPAGSLVTCCVVLPDGSVCDVDIPVSFFYRSTGPGSTVP